LKIELTAEMEIPHEIKLTALTKSSPVVMITHLGEDLDILNFRKFGAINFIVKPIEYDLFEFVTSVLGCYWSLLKQPFY
jgi:DNA-binding response OmpR family regulator